MRKGLLAAAGVIALAVAGIVALVLSGRIVFVLGWLFQPDHDFDPALSVPPPDYARESAWAALPWKKDESDLIPQGIREVGTQESAAADVFFIHPTGYLRGASWNSPIDLETATEENTKWMLANQASAFNGCCRVYAPRYREASIFAYFDTENGFRALDLAYQDVQRAFDYFVEHYSQGRPFLITSHSQGTTHAQRLLKEKIDGTALYDRMVAAYIIGGGLPLDVFERNYQRLRPCENAEDLHCVISWDTFGEGGGSRRPSLHWYGSGYEFGEKPTLCTNPLSWTRGEERAPAALNRGAQLPAGRFLLQFSGVDEANGISYDELAKPQPGHTWAQCRDGTLFVEEQIDNGFSDYGDRWSKTYHGLDYALFYMDVRENAKSRSQAYFKR
jgi:hypothetical protein